MSDTLDPRAPAFAAAVKAGTALRDSKRLNQMTNDDAMTALVTEILGGYLGMALSDTLNTAKEYADQAKATLFLDLTDRQELLLADLFAKAALRGASRVAENATCNDSLQVADSPQPANPAQAVAADIAERQIVAAEADKARLSEALRNVRRAIMNADPAVLTDTFWMPDNVFKGGTVVDFIDAALSGSGSGSGWQDEHIQRFTEALCAEDIGDPLRASGPILETVAKRVLDYVFRPLSAAPQPKGE